MEESMQMKDIIPKPVSAISTGGMFILTEGTQIYVEPGTRELLAVGQDFADSLKSEIGYPMQVLSTTGPPEDGNLYLTTHSSDPGLGEEGYELTVTDNTVTLKAHQPAGMYRGLQTIRQLLPPPIERSTVQPGPWAVETGIILDFPRFEWRGAMLDVSRHFFGVGDVKRFIDLMAYFKLNRFHIHLSDDQGWRLMINSWPKLATYGGSTQVGGGPGGFYTQEEYKDIVEYAQSKYIMIIPEIDMPGHTNAALASYAELNCDDEAPPLYTGAEVGFSSLCIDKEITYKFMEDVIREIASLTPGPYIHIGGDEAHATEEDAFLKFIDRAQAIVLSHGKHVVGWEEIAKCKLQPTTIVQHWHSEIAQQAAEQGVKIIMSPGSRTYLDMKYDPSTTLGLDWAGYIDVESAYTWEPSTQLDGISESDILGVEAPLWTETIETLEDVEFMIFPRLPGYAEIGWSPETGRDWEEYRLRLARLGPRLRAMGVNFYQSPQIAWIN
jgi:hexosaminidase